LIKRAHSCVRYAISFSQVACRRLNEKAEAPKSQIDERNLRDGEQILHLVAIGFVTGAIAVVMTPAAYHRQVQPDTISRHFVNLSSRLVTWGMFLLSVGICFDVYLIARIVLQNVWLSSLAAGALYLAISAMWFLLPKVQGRRK
jgi:hypothetical protein